MKNILIVHPTRGRPEQAKKIYDNITSLKSPENTITYIMAVDNDDPELAGYRALPKEIQIITGDNNGCVAAANSAYDRDLIARHDFVILASDDIYFPANWDIELIKVFDEVGYDKAIKTTNQFQGDLDLLNLQIGGSQFFLDYGTFFWPEYVSVYADQDITYWAKKNGRYIQARHLLFPHMQYSLSMPKEITDVYGAIPHMDETYERENRNSSYELGSQIFARRSAEGFPSKTA